MIPASNRCQSSATSALTEYIRALAITAPPETLKFVAEFQTGRPGSVDGLRRHELVAVLEQIGTHVGQILTIELRAPRIFRHTDSPIVRRKTGLIVGRDIARRRIGMGLMRAADLPERLEVGDLELVARPQA